MAGVNGGGLAGGEDQVVGGALALLEELAPRVPGERIPPEQGESDAGQQVGGAIGAANVSELVQQHHAAAFFGPGLGAGGHEDGRAAEAESHGHGSGGGFEDFDGAADTERAGERVLRFRRRIRTRGAADAAEPGIGEQHLGERERGAGGPEKHQAKGQIEAPRGGGRGRGRAGGGPRGASDWAAGGGIGVGVVSSPNQRTGARLCAAPPTTRGSSALRMAAPSGGSAASSSALA